MIVLILLFAPSVLALDVYLRISKNKISKKSIVTYGSFLTIINIFMLLITNIYTKYKTYNIEELMKQPSFTYKYLAIASIIGIIIAFIYNLVEENFKFNLTIKKVKHNEKEKKK